MDVPFEIAKEFNLADHVMFVLQTESGEALDKIEAAMPKDQVQQELSLPNDKSAMTVPWSSE